MSRDRDRAIRLTSQIFIVLATLYLLALILATLRIFLY